MFSVIDLRKDRFLKLIGIFLAVSSIAGFFHFGLLYYILNSIIAILLVRHIGKWNLDIKAIGFLLFVCFISLLVNDPPSYFNAWNRLAVYSIILIIISPLLVCNKANVLRTKVLVFIMETCVLLSVGSFIAYFGGINLFDRGSGYLDIGSGTFSGLMNHSIVLGHFGGLSAAFMLSRTLAMFKNSSWFKRLLFIFVTFSCYGACLLAASRNAVLSCIIASIIAFYVFFKDNIGKGFFIQVGVLLFLILSLPLWGGLTEYVIQKNEANMIQGGSYIYSRERKFNARIIEFQRSPLIGIGFCVVDPTLDVVHKENGQIEPGSSWLAVASMTGIIGFSLFLYICCVAFMRGWRNPDKETSCIMCSLLIFYYVHMISEGYIYAPRSFLSYTFWLIVASSCSFPTLKNIK